MLDFHCTDLPNIFHEPINKEGVPTLYVQPTYKTLCIDFYSILPKLNNIAENERMLRREVSKNSSNKMSFHFTPQVNVYHLAIKLV